MLGVMARTDPVTSFWYSISHLKTESIGAAGIRREEKPEISKKKFRIDVYRPALTNLSAFCICQQSRRLVGIHVAQHYLFAAVVASLSKGKVRQHLDGIFLLLDDGGNKILDGNHTDNSFIRVDNGQVANTLGHHLLHAGVDRFVSDSGDNVGPLRRNFLDRSVLVAHKLE